MADQTNAEVSDERLREGDDQHRFVVVSADYSRPFMVGAYPTLQNAVRAQCGSPERWHIFERRSVTSQASEGADDPREAIYAVLRDFRMPNMVCDDGSNDPYPLVDLVSNEAPADITTGESVLRDIADEIAYALLVAPVSKRVERLEEALKHIADGKMADYRDYARQALQGGRS